MKFLLKTISIASLVALTGCVTSEDIQSGVNTFKGQNYKAAFAQLGFPDAENKIAGHTVYTWGNQNSGSYTVPTYQTATTYVNGQAITTNIQGSRTESFNYECRLSLIVNSAGIVVDTKVEGNLGGCERYARFAPKPQPKKV
ncbi:hypothetical protein [Rhizobium sp. 2MFCol3.1]|uniref:hypothetical protein n=1 Tax=Rhizobium sp. 2MFCol3.1 TaxID=1246459 RepID=UPI0003A94B09|nr:hypothetical protein [Rhizobium sp. 2MFCol3.1]